jgi:cytochrome P450
VSRRRGRLRARSSWRGFAHGIHFCLGSALARLEGEVALTALLPRLARRQDIDQVVQRPTVAVRGIESFPMMLDARPNERGGRTLGAVTRECRDD